MENIDDLLKSDVTPTCSLWNHLVACCSGWLESVENHDEIENWNENKKHLDMATTKSRVH
jgi:hypothetical protein